MDKKLITGLILGAVNDSGTPEFARATPWVPRLDGGPAVGGGFVGVATWTF